MRVSRFSMVAAVLVCLAALPAAAQPAAQPAGANSGAAPDPGLASIEAAIDRYVEERLQTLGKAVARRFYQRSRRAFTVGAFASAAPSFALDGDSGTDAQVGGGLGVWAYDIPMLPRGSTFARLVAERALDKARDRLAAGSPPTQAEIEQIAKQSWDDLVAELTAEVQPRTFERPSARVTLSVLNGIDANSWDLRLGFAFGLGPVFVGTALAGQWDDGFALIVPLEVSVPLLLTDGFRAPVVDIFTRVELSATDRDDRADRVLVGARFAFDII